MKFSAAALVSVAAVGASANYHGNVTYVTEVVTALTTYCPEATTLTYGSSTYTITEATTLTISDCDCTISRPVYTSKVVECSTCGSNYTAPAPTKSSPTKPIGTGSLVPSAPSSVPTAGAGKAVALSGAGLAGLVGLAAFVL